MADGAISGASGRLAGAGRDRTEVSEVHRRSCCAGGGVTADSDLSAEVPAVSTGSVSVFFRGISPRVPRVSPSARSRTARSSVFGAAAGQRDKRVLKSARAARVRPLCSGECKLRDEGSRERDRVCARAWTPAPNWLEMLGSGIQRGARLMRVSFASSGGLPAEARTSSVKSH